MQDKDSYTVIFIAILIVSLSIIFGNLLFLPLLAPIMFILYKNRMLEVKYLRKIIEFIFNRTSKLNEVEIFDGYFISNNEYISVVLVYDIPVDYNDLSEVNLRNSIIAFYKILQVGDQVDILFRKKYVNINNFRNLLLNKAQNLRIILESDPSNSRAKRELEIVNFLLDKLKEGEYPFKYEIYLFVHGKTKERAIETAEIICRGLEGLNIKSRLAKKDEIGNVLFLKSMKSNKISIPSQIPFLTPFSISKLPSLELRGEGILLGKDMINKTFVFWNIDTAENPHLLVIGPTGAGKTEFLINFAINLSIYKNIPIVFFDTKGDIKERLKRKNVEFKVLNPLFHGISLLKSDNLPAQIRALQIEKILTNSFDLSKLESAIIFNIVYNTIEDYLKGKVDRLDWDVIEANLKERVDESVYLFLSKIFKLVKSVDFNYDLTDNFVNGINVIDLTLVKSETLRKLIIYSIMMQIYNKYSNIVDNGLKIVIILDEAWTILKSEKVDYPIVADLIKRGRGHGMAILMATQNIEDLGEMQNVYLDNVGLLIAMNNGDKNFWTQVIRRFANINDQEVRDILTFLGKGEALIRFLGDPRPVLVELNRI